MDWKSDMGREILAPSPPVSIQITTAMTSSATPSPEIANGFRSLFTHFQCRWKGSLPVVLCGFQVGLDSHDSMISYCDVDVSWGSSESDRL